MLAQDPSAQYLESDFFDTHYIQQDKSTNRPCDTDTDEEELNETEMNELRAPSSDTMLDNPHTDNINSISMTFAPGEGKRPVFHEPLAITCLSYNILWLKLILTTKTEYVQFNKEMYSNCYQLTQE